MIFKNRKYMNTSTMSKNTAPFYGLHTYLTVTTTTSKSSGKGVGSLGNIKQKTATKTRK